MSRLFNNIFSIHDGRKRRKSKVISVVPDFKVVTLGESGCGKTSLVQWFLKRRKLDQSEIGATVTPAFTRFKFIDDDNDLGNDGLSMGLWDTAGSERFLSLSRLYYRDAFAALLCYDVSDEYSWNRLRYWINELQENESNCRIYIVGCKADLPRQICPEKVSELADEYTSILYETSSETGFQIEEVFYNIYNDYKDHLRIKRKLDDEEITKVSKINLSSEPIEPIKRRCSC
ncbi:ras-related protein Rab-24 [Lepeophtheirus salmonis]|uniref:Uncharacterized protein n=1 Tax=Lepeophtheirus salmonis TaxID=72036 RepID=A0A0K2SY54_LEPSM|nr:ras-related protein Rab-24-like [Lepeophtheirus salmonis]